VVVCWRCLDKKDENDAAKCLEQNFGSLTEVLYLQLEQFLGLPQAPLRQLVNIRLCNVALLVMHLEELSPASAYLAYVLTTINLVWVDLIE
jgi:hypothetical protein